jgi:hypothetical protein
LQEKRQVLVAAALAAEAAVMEEEMLQRGGIQALLLPPPSLGVVIEIKYQGWVPNELVAMRTTRMMTSPSSSS